MSRAASLICRVETAGCVSEVCATERDAGPADPRRAPAAAILARLSNWRGSIISSPNSQLTLTIQTLLVTGTNHAGVQKSFVCSGGEARRWHPCRRCDDRDSARPAGSSKKCYIRFRAGGGGRHLARLGPPTCPPFRRLPGLSGHQSENASGRDLLVHVLICGGSSDIP
jgi:hypothetical protein